MSRLGRLKEKLLPTKKEDELGEPDRREWHIIIDVALCEDCNNCFLACKDEHVDNDFPGVTAPQPLRGQRWMNIHRKERGRHPIVDAAYRPTPCQHCREAPCLRAGQNGAVYRREDGIVIIDPVRAVGQRRIVDACPYGAVFWNEERNLPQKCTLCAHLLDAGWEKPRCVQSCPTGALRVERVEPGEMERIAKRENLETLSHGRNASRVYYRNLDRFDKCFIAGSVAYEKDGKEECAVGARVKVIAPDGGMAAELTADTFGDFKWDAAPPDSGTYTIEIEFEGWEKQRVEAEVTESVYIGVVRI